MPEPDQVFVDLPAVPDQEFPAYSVYTTQEGTRALGSLPKNLYDLAVRIRDEVLPFDPLVDPFVQPHPEEDGVFVYTHPAPPLAIAYRIDLDESTLEFMHFATFSARRGPSRIVVICSKDDVELIPHIRKFCNQLEKKSLAAIWDPTMLKAGDKRHERIREEVEAAEMAILLVTQSFIDEDYQGGDLNLAELLQSAETEALRILWVAVSASTYQDTDLEKYEAVNNPESPLLAFEDTKAKFAAELLKIYNRIRSVLLGPTPSNSR